MRLGCGYHPVVVAEELDAGGAANGGPRCLNCGALTGPRFCGDCGQAVDDRRSPLLALLRELFEEWLSVDGRLIHTLRVMPRPGELTRLYLAGKRAPFLTPFRVYLLASLALFSSVLTLRPPKVDDINFYIGDVLIGHEHVRGRTTVTMDSPDFGLPSVVTPGADNFEARLRALPPQQVLDGLFNGMRDALPIGLILFVPVLAGVLKLLYLRSRVLYVDHLVFAVHFQSALFVTLAVVWVLVRLFRFSFFASIITYVPVGLLMLTIYLGWALRRVYGQGRWLTAGKTAVLVLAYLVLARQTLGIPVLWVLSRM